MADESSREEEPEPEAAAEEEAESPEGAAEEPVDEPQLGSPEEAARGVRVPPIPLWLLLVICVGVSALFMLVGIIAGPGDPVDRAKELRDQGRAEEAVSVLEEAAARPRHDPLVHWHLGRLYLAQDRPLHAEEEFRRYLALEPRGPYAPAARIRLLALAPPAETDEPPAFEEPITPSATARSPGDQVFLNATWRNAQAAERGGDFRGALGLYAGIVQRLPSYERLGEVFERMGVCASRVVPANYGQARQHFARAAREYRRIGSRTNASRCLALAIRQADLERAAESGREAAAREATRVDPAEIRRELSRQHAEGRYREALAAWDRGEPTVAVIEAQAAVREDPQLAEARFLLGSIHEARGDWAAAAEEYAAFAELRPRDAAAKAALGQVRLLQTRKLLFGADFERGVDGFVEQTTGSTDGTLTVPRSGSPGADGSAHSLIVTAGRECLASFTALEGGTVQLSFYDPGAGAPGPQVKLLPVAGNDVVIRATPEGYELVGAVDSEEFSRRAGWRQLTVETDDRTLTAFVDGEFLGVMRVPPPINGMTLGGPTAGAGASYYDQVRVIADVAPVAEPSPEPAAAPARASSDAMPPPTTPTPR